MDLYPPASGYQRDPVVVVGAGPVGMVTALELSRLGVPSLLLEAQPMLQRRGSRGIVIQATSLEILERIGALEILERGLQPERRRTFFGNQELFSQDFLRPQTGALPHFVNLPQDDTERILLETIQKHHADRVQLAWNCTVQSLAQDATGVTVVTQHDGVERVLRTPYVVGTDGCRSAVRKAIGFTLEGHTDASKFLIADVRAALPWPKEHHFTFAPGDGQGQTRLVVPQPDDLWRMDWQLADGEDAESAMQPAAMRRRVQALIGDAVPAEVVWVSCYQFHQRIVEAYQHHRVFLAGDSAHLMAPFGARGMNSGFQDAENLAWKLARVYRGDASPALLDSYTQERHEAGRANQQITSASMRFISPQSAVERHERDAILRRSAGDAQARAHVDSGRMSAPHHYRTSSLHRSAHAMCGMRFPDAPVHEGKRSLRLRHLVAGSDPVTLERADACLRVIVGKRHAGHITDDALLPSMVSLPTGTRLALRPDSHILDVQEPA